MPALLTRRELYELVWTRPMTKVAQDLGVSDVALHKICKKHGIPKPERGYWAKLTAGKPVEKKPLTDNTESGSSEILISGSATRDLAPEVLEAKRKTEALARATADESQVFQTPADPHPLIERLEAMLKKSKPNKKGFISIRSKKDISVYVSPTAAQRAVDIVESFVAQAEALGYAFVEESETLELEISSERISISIAEQLNRVAHIPTAAELARKAKWEKARERAARRGQYFSAWDQPTIPEWDHVPNGNLVLQLDAGYHRDGIRRKFSDGKHQRLENLMPAIFAAAAAYIGRIVTEH